jgi:murein DD-endopeptidase MepM/ murein hydrolase activator NlpD
MLPVCTRVRTVARAIATLLAILPVSPAAAVAMQVGDTARSCAAMRTTPVPAAPRAGTLFRVRVILPAAFSDSQHGGITGTVAGEPLHFVQRGDTLESLAAMPVDSSDGTSLSLSCADASGTAVITSTRIDASDGAYKLEKLTVAPRFGTPPDSAVAARMRREAEQSAAVSRGSHDTPRLWSTTFLAPRDGRVTSGFGNGRTFNGEVTSRHTGTDYAGAIGAPVRAINRGIVRIVDAFYLGGNVVYIDHGGGMVSAYLHLSRQDVAVGDTVARGQVIGRVGATGRVTGPHLHLITRYGAVSVDASSVIGKQ